MRRVIVNPRSHLPVYWSLWAQYALALGAVAAALGLRLLLDPLLGNRVPYIMVLIALLLLVAWVRPGPFLAAAMAAWLASWYLFVPPRYSFTLESTVDAAHVILFAAALVVVSITVWMVSRSHDRARDARAKADARREALRVTLASIGDAVITTDAEGRVTFLNEVAVELTGWESSQAISRSLREVFIIINEQTRLPVDNPVEKVLELGQTVGLANHTVLIRRDGNERPIDDSAAPIRNAEGNIIGVVLVFRDITSRRRAEVALDADKRVLEQIASGMPLPDVLNNLMREIEAQSTDGMLCSILLLDSSGKKLLHGAAPSLPEAYNQAINGVSIGHNVGSCGAAAFRRQPVFVTDIATDPIWINFRDLAARHGLAACCSTPIFSGKGELLGTIAMYYRRPHNPGMHDRQLIERATRLAGIVIERKRAEEAQAILAAIVQDSDDAIVSKTLNGIIVSWNGGAERVFGYSADDAIGRSIELIVPPELRDEERAILDRLRRGERIDHFETVRLARDGRRINISLTVSPVRDGTGRIIGASKVARDVTDRKQAEQSLAKRASEQQALYQLTDRVHRAQSLDEIYDASLDSILSALNCDRASILLFDDADVMRFVGWRGLSDGYRHAVEGHSPWQRGEKNPHPISVSDIEQADIPEPLKNTIRTEGVRALGFIPLISDSQLIGKFMVYYNAPHVFSDAELDLAVTIGRQLAFGVEKARTEQVLRDTAERLNLATQTGKLGIWDWDIASNRVAWSDSLYVIHGLKKHEFDATIEGFSALVHPDDRNLVSNAIERSLAGEAPYELEFRARRPDGKVIWLFTNALVLRHGSTPRRMTGATVDITERKRAEEELRNADRRKDEFLATLAHELRNPLAPLRNSLEIINRPDVDRTLLRQAGNMMQRQVDQLVRLVDDLLDIGRITRDKLELRTTRVELASIIHHAVEICRPLADREKHVIEVLLPERPVELQADPVRLIQIFSNLLNNACKYTHPRGQIRLTAERQRSDVVVSVKDNGVGIPPDKLDSIFEMFAQVDTTLERARGGLGIGLTLVKRLVELHGGAIEARSEGPGRGSEFIVRLPVLVAEPQLTVANPLSVPSMEPRRILVVDDNRDSADSLAKLLTLGGHHVDTAYDGLEAVEAAEKCQPDVILLDIGLPRLNGYDAARRIRQQSRHKLPVLVALSGWGQDEDLRRSKEAGFDRHLVKPVDYHALMKLLAANNSGAHATHDATR